MVRPLPKPTVSTPSCQSYYHLRGSSRISVTFQIKHKMQPLLFNHHSQHYSSTLFAHLTGVLALTAVPQSYYCTLFIGSSIFNLLTCPTYLTDSFKPCNDTIFSFCLCLLGQISHTHLHRFVILLQTTL